MFVHTGSVLCPRVRRPCFGDVLRVLPNDGLGCRLGLRYEFFYIFVRILLQLTTDTSITLEDRAGNGWRCGKRAQMMARLSLGP